MTISPPSNVKKLNNIGSGVKIPASRIDRGSKPMSRLLTLKESAAYVGRSVPSMRELLYGHELKCIQKGNGKIWVDIRDLDAWIDKNKAYI